MTTPDDTGRSVTSPLGSRSLRRGTIGALVAACGLLVGSGVAAAAGVPGQFGGPGIESIPGGMFGLATLAIGFSVLAGLSVVLFGDTRGVVPTFSLGFVFVGAAISMILLALLWSRGYAPSVPIGTVHREATESGDRMSFIILLFLFVSGYVLVPIGVLLDRRKLEQFRWDRRRSLSAPPVTGIPSMLWLFPAVVGLLFWLDMAVLTMPVLGMDPLVPWGLSGVVPPVWALAYGFRRSQFIDSRSPESTGASVSGSSSRRSVPDSSGPDRSDTPDDAGADLDTVALRGDLTDAVATLNDAWMAYDEGEYNEEWVLDACETASETAENVLEAIQPVWDADDEDTDRDIEWIQQKATDVVSRAESLREDVHGETDAEDNTEELSSAIEAIETNLETAAEARTDREYDDALAAVETAIEAADDVRTTATDHAPDRLEEIESRIDEAERLRGEIEAERDDYGSAIDRLATLEERLDAAADALDAGDPEVARERLDAICDAIAETADDAEEYEFDDVDGRLDELSSRCERLRDRARDAIAPETNTPDSIPAPPRRSLAYDDIEIGDPIGSGGNATVYRATATVDGESLELALKKPRLSGTLHTETVDRMLQEAETWQQLDDHDHVVSVIDYGSEPLPWIAMEYMGSGDLGDRAGELPFGQALWTAIAITKAIRHAHRRGVAHLDLKPENVLFRSVEDAWDVPKVADWGLSRHLLQHPQSVDGLSPQYAAPEQFDDSHGEVDDITDVYQLGTVLYELFTGRRPFEGEPTRVMQAVLNDAPAPPSEYADLPPEIDEVLLTALAADRSDRYESVLYLRDALQDVHSSA
jgi:hypothetical protein